MKKVLFIVCVLALVVMATTAYAAAGNWLISIRGVNPVGFGGAGGIATVGVGTAAPTVQGWPTTTGSTAQAESTGETAYHARHMVPQQAGPESYAWDLKIGARSDYNGDQIALCVWNNQNAALGVGGELNHALIYRLSTGGHTVAWFSDAALEAQSIAANSWGDLTNGNWVDAAQLLKASSSWAPSSANPGWYLMVPAVKSVVGGFSDLADYRLEAITAPTVVTPEPGSMLALGSGLFGLVGFVIRRRRA